MFATYVEDLARKQITLIANCMENLNDRELERFLLREVMQENSFTAFPTRKETGSYLFLTPKS